MRAEQMAARIERERIQAEAAEAARVAKAAEEGKIDKSMDRMIMALLKSFKMRSDCCDDKLWQKFIIEQSVIEFYLIETLVPR